MRKLQFDLDLLCAVCLVVLELFQGPLQKILILILEGKLRYRSFADYTFKLATCLYSPLSLQRLWTFCFVYV